MEIITMYRAKDGRMFDSKEECLSYEHGKAVANVGLDKVKFINSHTGELFTVSDIYDDSDNYANATHFIVRAWDAEVDEVLTELNDYLELHGFVKLPDIGDIQEGDPYRFYCNRWVSYSEEHTKLQELYDDIF